MASENETVADIVNEMRGEAVSRHPLDERMCDFSSRIEAAHKREMEHRALIAGVSLADAVDEAHKRDVAELRDDVLRLKDIIADERAQHASGEARGNAEVAELRECLKEAVELMCKKCAHYDVEEHKCYDGIECPEHNCTPKKWRKALEGCAPCL